MWISNIYSTKKSGFHQHFSVIFQGRLLYSLSKLKMIFFSIYVLWTCVALKTCVGFTKYFAIPFSFVHSYRPTLIGHCACPIPLQKILITLSCFVFIFLLT